MIRMTNIQKRYRMGDQIVAALDGVSLHIQANDFVAIVGPSGSGKSTLMNIIGCLDTADAGQYHLDGTDITDYTDNELARVRNRKIGFIFQSFNLLNRLSALENVELPLIYQGLGPRERRRVATEAIERVGLTDRMRHRPNELSGGQQQRVAIARALCTHPSLLLADEPTGNLDSQTGADIIAILRELHAAGNTVVLITHDDEVAAQAPRRLRIRDGKISQDD